MTRRASAVATILALAAALSAGGCADRDPKRPPVGSLVVETEGDGWIRITGRELLAAGLDSLSDPRKLGLSHRGTPVALRVVPGDAETMFDVEAIEFWAWRSGSLYQRADTWVLGPAEDPPRIDELLPPPAPGTPGLRAVVEAAPETFYAMGALNGERSNWYWDYVFANGGPAAKELTITATRPSPEGTARLVARLHGYTFFDEHPIDHHAQVYVNGVLVADVTSDGNAPIDVDASFPASVVREGINAVRIVLPLDTGAPFETLLVQSLALDHPRRPAPEEDALAPLVLEGAGTLALDGHVAGTEAFDLSDPAWPRRAGVSRVPAPPAIPPPSDGEDPAEVPAKPMLEVTVAGGAPIVIVPPDAKRAPTRLRAIRGGDPAAGEAADLVVIAPEALAPAAERLVQHRRSTGVSARVVLWEHVVDHHGGGYADPAALAAFVRALAPPPRWVLLFGDASYDPRGLLPQHDGKASNRIPASFGDTPFLETPTDNPVVAPSAREAPEIAVGRIPAADLGEADAVVDKILAYETAPDVPDDVLLVADDAPTSWEYQLFIATSDQIAANLAQEPFPTSKLYLGSGGVSSIRTSLFDALAGGAAWVGFMGHGNFTRWAQEGVLTAADVASLPEAGALPVYAAANCLTAHWTHPNSELRSLGERLLVQPRRGAVAVFGSTALVYPDGQAELSLALVDALLVDRDATLGDALVRAKAGLDPPLSSHADILASWTLLGDPSMRVRTP